MKVTKRLPVGMSDAELQAAGTRLANLEHERRSIENDAKDAAASFRKKLKPLRKEIGELADEVRKGQRLEDVECEELRDATTNEIIVTRLDTGEQIREAPEEEDGQQKLLPGPAPKKKAKPAPAMPKGGAGGIDPKGGDKGRARRRRS